MEKNAFISLLKRYHSTTDVEADAVIDLRKQFPYSQVLQSLAARVSKDHGLTDHQTILQAAAVYAADRNALKEIFAAPFVAYQPTELTEEKTVEVASIPTSITQPEDQIPPIEKTVIAKEQGRKLRSIDHAESVDYADEIIRDLEKLNSLKHNFEMLFVEYSEIQTKPKQIESEAELAAPSNDGEHVAEKTIETGSDSSTKKSKKARIVELAKKLTSATPTDHEQTKGTSRKKNPSEALIDEIQLTKEELAPESEKQKEQIEMIDQFMRTQPSISPVKERQTPPIGDLNPIKSGEFGDNIVSETLVEILVKQGKKEKAIEVLKKLIWKYPQKKTYFASQIEDLKK